MHVIGVLTHPRSTIAALSTAASAQRGALVVAASGAVCALISLGITGLERSGMFGIVTSLLIPPLFLAYWMAQAWLIDAGARLLRRGDRVRFLAVSGHVFPAWVGYALVNLGGAAATAALGSASALAVALGVLALPVLIWILVLTVIAIHDVYDVPPLNAFALALLPYAALSFAVLLLGATAGAIRGT